MCNLLVYMSPAAGNKENIKRLTESLNLSGCYLEPSGLQSLVTAQLPQLVDLNLNHHFLDYNAS